MTPKLARLAIKRHRVGPLLGASLTAENRIKANGNAAARLIKSYKANGARRLKQLAAAKNVSKILADNDIAYWPVKGEALASQLYDDPNKRWAIDVDLLIQPKDSERAVKLLQNNGYRAAKQKNPGLPFAGKRLLLHMRMNKDISLYDPQYSQQIELHQRLNYYEPAGLSNWCRDQWPSAEMGNARSSEMLFYLLLHGSMDRWARLKWSADMSLALRKASPAQIDEILAIGQKFQCRHAVLAGLYWTEIIFPSSLPTETLKLVQKYIAANHSAQKLINAFKYALSNDNHPPKKLMPRHFPTPAWQIYKGMWHKAMLIIYVPIAAIIRRI